MKTLLSLLIIVFLNAACSGQPNDFPTETTLPSTSDGDSGNDKEPQETPPTSTATPLPSNEAAVRDVIPLWEAKVTQGRTWSDHVDRQLETLGADLLDVIPADRATFCPKYSSLSYSQRKQYWTYMLSAMTRFESNFNTNSTYTEAFNDSNGKKVISRGLLQISIESGNAYGCGFRTAQELHDPLKNLSCGIRILNRWVARDGRIAGKVTNTWRGGARYWAVLREGDKTSYQSILKWSKELSICK